jgi:hypothetical protein
MAAYTTVADWQDVEGNYVVDVTIRQTEDEQYPSGWDYSLHLGEVGGDTVLRYDNAHERTKGHERHAGNDVERIEFPGMLALYDRFKREAEKMSPVSWDWPE